jgi:fibronectin-binding autotransporter adhesin
MRRVGAGCGMGTLIVLWLALAAPSSADTYRPTRIDDPTPNGCKPHDCSLREAVEKANSHPGPDTIEVIAGNTYTLEIPSPCTPCLNGNPLKVTGPLTITSITRHGGSETKARIDGDQRSQVINSKAPLKLSKLIISGGYTEDRGGGLYLSGDATIERTEIETNFADLAGGGIYTNAADVTLNHSVVVANQAGSGSPGGGGIWAAGDLLKVVHSDVNLNRAIGGSGDVGGGGIMTSNKFGEGNPHLRLMVRQSEIHDNFVYSGNDTELDADGGGILENGPTSIIDSKIFENIATRMGGGLLAEPGAGLLDIQSSTIDFNTANPGRGGGIASSTKTRIADSTITGNKSNLFGGGLYLAGAADASLLNSTIALNKADRDGGGIYALQRGGSTHLNDVTVAFNVADADSNSAGAEGGGGLFGASTFKLENSLVAQNSAMSGGPPDCEGTRDFTSLGHNLIGDTTGCDGFPGPADLVNLDPELRPLDDYGGPTQTVALKKGSPAIGHADKQTSLQRDQRGVERDKHPDIGAYERLARGG